MFEEWWCATGIYWGQSWDCANHPGGHRQNTLARLGNPGPALEDLLDEGREARCCCSGFLSVASTSVKHGTL